MWSKVHRIATTGSTLPLHRGWLLEVEVFVMVATFHNVSILDGPSEQWLTMAGWSVNKYFFFI